MLTVLEVLLGLFILVNIFTEIFEAVVMTYPLQHSLFRVVPMVYGKGLWLFWRKLGKSITPILQRELFYASFAPLSLVMILMFWIVGLMAGFALLYWALATQFHPVIKDYPTAFYMAATTLMSANTGAILPVTFLAQLLYAATAVIGLGIFGIYITWAFMLTNYVKQRDVLVLRFSIRNRSHMTMLPLLSENAKETLTATLNEAFSTWEGWASDILLTHVAYPVMPYFRSFNQWELSWLNALEIMLDIASMVIVTEEPGALQSALRFYQLGTQVLYSFCFHYRLEIKAHTGTHEERYQSAFSELKTAGFEITDPEQFKENFNTLRHQYERHVATLMHHLAIPDKPIHIDHERFFNVDKVKLLTQIYDNTCHNK